MDFMNDINNLKELVSRYMVNHFVIGYFALFIIYGDCFISKSLLFQITMAIVASYLLFIPARLIVRLIYGEEEDDSPKVKDKKIIWKSNNLQISLEFLDVSDLNDIIKRRIIYKFYHLRIFFALFVLTVFYFVEKIIYPISESERIYFSVILFVFIILSDCFAYKFTKWTNHPKPLDCPRMNEIAKLINGLINKLTQKIYSLICGER